MTASLSLPMDTSGRRADPLPVCYVEFKSQGHTSVHLAAFVHAARRAVLNWKLDLWVGRAFLEEHRELVSELSDGCSSSVAANFHSIEELPSLGLARSERVPEPQQFGVVRRCAERSGSRVCYIASLDGCVRDLAAGQGSGDVLYTGTLLYPYLHYPFYPLHKGRGWPPRWRRWAKSYLLHFLLCRRREVPRVLTIDPLAVDWYNRHMFTRKYSYLPDYVDRTSARPGGRERLQLPADRVVFGFLGVINNRKGAIEFVTAMGKALQRDVRLVHSAAFLFAGVVIPDSRETFYHLISRLRSEFPAVPVVVLDQFISQEEFVTCISVSDVLCIPYPRHIGLSSLLFHAGAYGKPVLGPEFGTVGELIRRFGLGAQCDPMDTDTLAETISQMVRRARLVDETERARLRRLFAERSLENFGDHMVRAVVEAGS